MAPMNSSTQITVSADHSRSGQICSVSPAKSGALPKMAAKSSVPNSASTAAMPSIMPRSPTRLTRKALRFAKIAVGFSYQKPISRYETRPTPSQPKNSCRKLLAVTNISMANVNRLM